MCLSLLVFTQFLFEFARSQPAKPIGKQNLTRNSRSMSFEVIHFGITEKSTTAYRHIITLASSLKYPKNSHRNRWKLPFSITPLSFDAPSPGNLCEHSHVLIPPKTRVIVLYFSRWQYGSIFIQIFVVGTEIRIFSVTYSAYRPFKVIHVVDFGTNRKGVWDVILVINSDFGPILHRFWDTASYWLKFANFSYLTLI